MLPHFREPIAHSAMLTDRQRNQQQGQRNLKSSPSKAAILPFLMERFGHNQRLRPFAWSILFSLLFSALSLFWSPVGHAQSSTEESVAYTLPSVAFSEVHYKPEPSTEWIEFIEIHNAGESSIDLSGWLIDGGIRYLFPAGSAIGPDGYLVIAQNPEAFGAKYGLSAAGQFQGRLSNDGEQLTLRSNTAAVVDEMTYQLGFPWPTVGTPPGNSIQLIQSSLDNAHGGAWRSALPSPGGPGAIQEAGAPPFVDQVSHNPQQPTSNDVVTISARVNDADGVASVALLYQIVAPGEYVAQHDPAFQSDWTPLAMSQVDDEHWQIALPASLQQHRHLIRYRIHARDATGRELTVPYADDPQPNFAYFVYDGLPPWTGSYNGSPENHVTFDFNQMRPLPIYHFIAKRTDVADALFMPPSGRATGYEGSDYLWRGTLVYDGRVYDHVTFRARGGTTRYATGKNMWKINFHPGHRFQAYDDYGRPYDTKWDKLNLSATIQQTHRKHRGEQGMFESISFRLFNMAGVEGPLTHFAHLRVIDEQAEIGTETGANQYEGDFWGLYLAIEQMDGRFLEQHDLPDGNLYKLENGGAEKNNQGAYADLTHNDITGFIVTYVTTWQDENWWRANLDLDRYYSYRAIVEAIHHYDIDQGKNFFYFADPTTSKWSVHPWDLDLTWSNQMPGTGKEPFFEHVLERTTFQIEYQNRMREVRDLLFNPEQMTLMLDEHANLINTSANGLTMVDADRHLWDYNPIFQTGYVDPKRTYPGEFYRAGETGDFPGMVALMRNWVDERSRWIDSSILTDEDHPTTPAVNYIGAPGFPADQLQFHATEFQDPQGSLTFAAMQWRIAEVTNPEGPIFNSAAPRIYEIDAIAESGEITTRSQPWTLPNGTVEPLHTYRIRVRMKDNSGRWSHWSPALQFIAGIPVAQPETNLALTEIMYHPLPVGPRNGDDFEFIELTNTGTDLIDLSNFHFTQGIEYRFPPGSALGAGQRLILAGERSAFDAVHSIAAYDEYSKRLGNGGERLTLVDAYGRAIFSLAFSDEAPWPVDADGDGYSLVLNDESADDQEQSHWRRSSALGGSPGIADPQPVKVNELLSNPTDGAEDKIELYNPGDLPADIGDWMLSDDLDQPAAYRIAAGTVIPANGHLTLTADHFDPSSGRSTRPDFDAQGGQIHLLSADETEALTGYRHGFSYGAATQGISLGRLTTTDGREHFVQQQAPSFGSTNPDPAVGPIVISEINYHPSNGDEYIELTNNSDLPVKLYDPSDPEQTWRIDGIFYEFAPGIEMPARGSLLLVAKRPSEVCLARDGVDGSTVNAPMSDETQVVGPYPVRLADGGQSITLLKPATLMPTTLMSTTMQTATVGDLNNEQANRENAYVIVDQVDYNIGWPVTAANQGAALRRVDLGGFGNEPTNWQELVAAGGIISAADALSPHVGICAFEAFQNEANAGRSSDSPIEVHWVSHTETNVAAYRLWRSPNGSRTSAEQINQDPIVAQGTDSSSARYQFIDSSFIDSDGQERETSTYWLEAVSETGAISEIAFTRTQQPISQSFFPMINR